MHHVMYGQFFPPLSIVIATPPITWNPSDKSSNITLSGGNLTELSAAGGSNCIVRATGSISVGRKVYFELFILSGGNGAIGIDDGMTSYTSFVGMTGSFGWGYYFSFADIFHNGFFGSTSLSASTGNTVSIAIDNTMGASTMTIYVNSSASMPVENIASQAWFPAAGGAPDGECTAHFTVASFTQTALWATLSAAGFTAL